MRTPFRLAAALTLSTLVAPALAHIRVLSPNGGETLFAGGSFEIEWEILIPHNLEHWDLYYARDLGPGNWVPIVLDLDPGDPSIGSLHVYTWTVPEFADDSVWVRVVMVNDTAEYLDNSNGSFAIVPSPASGTGFVLILSALPGRRRP